MKSCDLKKTKIYHGIAKGELHYFSEFLSNRRLSIFEISKKYSNYFKILENELNNCVHLDKAFKSNIYHHTTISWSEIFCFINSYEFNKIIKQHLYVRKNSIYSSFVGTIREVFDKEIVDLYCVNSLVENVEVFKECLEYVSESISRALYRTMFQESIKDVNYNIVVFTFKFNQDLFFDLSPYIKGFIFDNVSDLERIFFLTNELSIPCVISKDPGLHGNKIFIDSKNQLVEKYHSWDKLLEIDKDELRNIEKIKEQKTLGHEKFKLFYCNDNVSNYYLMNKSDWINGVCYYKPELQYMTSGTVKKRNEICEDLGRLCQGNKGKEFFISLPNFKSDLTISYLENYVLDENMFEDFPVLFIEFVEGVKLAQALYEVDFRIAIPFTRNNEDYQFWKMMFDYFFYFDSKTKKPQIGIVIDNLEAIESSEGYEDYDFSIIDINGWIEEYNPAYKYAFITLRDLQLKILPDIKSIHQYYRKYGIKKRHIVVGHCIGKNLKILQKLINSGFREFAITPKYFAQAKEIIDEHVRTRGNFIGEDARRKQRKKEMEEEKKLRGNKKEPKKRTNKEKTTNKTKK